MATALITRIFNGIGFELAKIHASKGDNLVLVAGNKSKRDERKATTIKQVFKHQIYMVLI